MGESDKPLMRYSTSEMAKDVVDVLDHIGWTAQRHLHVIGISMGGMIAQELVCDGKLTFEHQSDRLLGSPDTYKDGIAISCFNSRTYRQLRGMLRLYSAVE